MAKPGRGSVFMIDYNKGQADMARDALIKAIYSHLFDWVVEKARTRTEAAPKLT